MKETIRKIDLFNGLDDRLLRKLSETATTHSWAKDETIVREGDVGIGMYFLVRGRTAMTSAASGERVEINGDQFLAEVALMALSDHKPRLSSIVALDETECLLLPRDSFIHLMEKHPSLSVRMAKLLAERLRDIQSRPVPKQTGAASPAGAPASVPAPVEGDGGMKAGIQKQLIETFDMLYTLKAFTRFSVAVLGCPVEGWSADAVEVIRLGDVKAVIMPAGSGENLTINAYGEGQFQLHLFDPARFAGGAPRALAFEPQPIQPLDRFTLNVAAATLTREVAR